MAVVRYAGLVILAVAVVVTGMVGVAAAGIVTSDIAPEVKEGIINIECHPQKFTMRRVDGDPYRFYTYVPHDIETERFSGPEGTGIRFWLSRSNEERNQAYAEIFVFPPGTTRAQTEQIVKEMMSRSGWDKYERKYEEKKSFPWSISEQRFTAAWYSMGSKRIPIGSIVVGQHGELFFGVMCHYRAAFSDGFVPRYLRILDEFVWTDTNEGLGRVEMQRCSKVE